MKLLHRFQLIRFLSWDAKRPTLRSHAEAWERCLNQGRGEYKGYQLKREEWPDGICGLDWHT